eukprot:674046-Rhodomonas_salina.2
MDATALKRRGITHILNLSTYDKNPKCHHHGQFEYMILNLPDLPSTNLEQYFPRTNAFISTGRERGGVYVHCMWGMSRGPSTVMAYLIAEQKMDFREALSAVKSVRPQTHPNHGFQRQLEGYVQTMANRNSYGASYGGSNTQPSNYNNNTASNTSPGVPRVLRTKTVPRETASPGSGDEGALAQGVYLSAPCSLGHELRTPEPETSRSPLSGASAQPRPLLPRRCGANRREFASRRAATGWGSESARSERGLSLRGTGSSSNA